MEKKASPSEHSVLEQEKVDKSEEMTKETVGERESVMADNSVQPTDQPVPSIDESAQSTESRIQSPKNPFQSQNSPLQSQNSPLQSTAKLTQPAGENSQQKSRTNLLKLHSKRPADSSQSAERCPICDYVFPPSMSLLRRTQHVDECLTHPRPQQSSTEDVLWEAEEAPPSSKKSHSKSHKLHIDVRGRGHHVILDDGDDAYYISLVSSYLEWRRSVHSQDSSQDRAFQDYQTLSNVLNAWDPSTASSLSLSSLHKQLETFYKSEPALLLPSGHAVPTHLWEILYPYQQKGVLWMLELHSQQIGGIIADEMGLGKTIQIITVLVILKFTREVLRVGRSLLSLPRAGKGEASSAPLELNQSHRPTLVIVPATLLGHWLRELRRWCPLLRSVVVHSSSQTMANRSLYSVLGQCKKNGRFDVIITTYEGFRKDPQYRKTSWFYAILDEGGKIKNAKVTISQECKKLRTLHRILISGTPLQNNLKELWSLIDFVFPGRLGTLEAFVSAFVIPISRGIYSNASAKAANLGYQCSLILQDTINPIILRRLKKV